MTVAGIPLVDRVVAGMRSVGVDRVVVVTGHMAAAVESHMAGDDAVLCVRQPELDGTAGAILAAREFAEGEQILVAWTDVVVFPDSYRVVIEALQPGAAAVTAVNAVDDPYEGAAVYVAEGSVERIVEKPARGTSTTVWNNSGIMALQPDMWSFIETTPLSDRGEREMTAALNGMIAAGRAVVAVELTGPVIDVGTADRLAEADLMFGRLR